METPVKERLVGAVILVLLMAILVPELLSGPQHAKPAASSGSGGPAAPLRTYTIDLSGNSAAPTKPAAVPQPEPVSAAVTTTSSPSSTPHPVPLPQGERELATDAGKKVPSPLVGEGQGEGSQASITASPPPAPAPKSASSSGWVVQLGSFSKSQNAERLVKQLKAKHYNAFVSRAGTGAKARYRVRVGPEKERAEAQALAERLKREGQQVSIIPQP